LFLQGHLISSQLFVFWVVFVFVYGFCRGCVEDLRLDFLKNLESSTLAKTKSFERLMCEVEFWEVFLGKERGLLKWCP